MRKCRQVDIYVNIFIIVLVKAFVLLLLMEILHSWSRQVIAAQMSSVLLCNAVQGCCVPDCCGSQT